MELGIPTFGLRNGRNEARVGGGILHTPSEHHIPVHFDPTNTGAVSGGIEEAGIMGDTTVVGKLGSGPGGRKDVGGGANGGWNCREGQSRRQMIRGDGRGGAKQDIDADGAK